jgi:glycosyltransferase domain-containing protein
MTELLTILIPTFNRPDDLARTVGFLARNSSTLPIVIADGSNQKNATLTPFYHEHPNITYFHYPEMPMEGSWNNYNRRINSALELVRTPYAVFCADDDLLIYDAAIQSAQFLDAHPDYIACHGHYLLFEYSDGSIRISNSEYEGPSIDADSIGGRLIQLFSRYEAPFYAVFRTEILRLLMHRCSEPSPPLWPEIYHASAAVIAGKIRRNDMIYSLRNAGNPPHYHSDSSVRSFAEWATVDLDSFLDHYRTFRKSAVEWARSDVDSQTLGKTLDLAFMLYVGSEFNPYHWIDQCIQVLSAESAHQRAQLQLRLKQNLIQGKIRPEPFYSVPSAGWQVFKSLIGRRGMNFMRDIRRRGASQALSRARRTKNGWVTVYDQRTSSEYGIHVASSMVDKYPPEQWTLLRGIPK